MALLYIRVIFMTLSASDMDGLHPTCLLTVSVGHDLTIKHALNCKCGGFLSIRHNELRDITADLLTEVCHNVLIEPPLLPLNGESLYHQTAITEDNVRDNIVMSDFWSSCQHSFLDVCVFNPFTSSYIKSPLKACH